MEINVTTLFVLMINGFVKINIDIFKNENIFLYKTSISYNYMKYIYLDV